ncbi:MAG: energy-coupling factor transporter transmembrane protein EcfT [Gemmatimonadales bacterium]|nr:energy-coupling factor transporter transmembrane protein EcfT [Gemmatimonadales bacterium]
MISGAAFSTAALRSTSLSRVHPVSRLGGLVLGLASSMLAGPITLAVIAVALIFVLTRTGLGPKDQTAALKPWRGASILILLIHVFTSTWAAPLWHPSVAGLLAGVKALARVACTIGWLGLYLRTSSLDDLVLGTHWWLRPLSRLGVPTQDLGLVLAVALGTVPGVLGEGRRIETVVRLRRTGPLKATGDIQTRNFLKGKYDSLLDKVRVVIPLLETLVRRAETLSLSLRTRRPVTVCGSTGSTTGPSIVQLTVLVLWFAALVWFGIGHPGVRWD